MVANKCTFRSWIKLSIGLILFVAGGVNALTPDAYVTIKDGHLFKNGQRVRFWAPNIYAVGDRSNGYKTDYATIDAGVQRLKKLGFNAVRYWTRELHDPNIWKTYQKGDGSEGDFYNYFIYKLKEEGFVVWTAGLNHGDKIIIRPEDVSVIDDPATAEAWKQAVAEKPGSLARNVARAWDPRLRELGKRQLKKYLDHYNPYTGLHAYEDPVYAVWELTNEEWWIPRMMNGSWKDLPVFFRTQLLTNWNRWLKKKYHSTEQLRQAWVTLLENESLEKGTVAFAPIASGAVTAQLAVLGAGAVTERSNIELTREMFSKARSEDVVRFIVETGVAYKRELEQFVRQYGKKGLGCQIVPILFDTGMANELQNAYLHAQADATCAGAYINAFTTERQDPRFPWLSGLLESPRLYWDNPWLEHNRIEGKPHFVYEVNIFNPSKYRTEYPYRMAALASIQDWDWVSWYVLDGFRDAKLDKPYSGSPMNYAYDAYGWNGAHFIYDEVLGAALKSAGELFTQFALKPAAKPTIFRFGEPAIYNMAMQHYQVTEGLNIAEALAPTTYRYGTRLVFEDKDLPAQITGPYVHDRAFQAFIIKPTDQITYDWQKGYIQFDTPSAKVITGFLPDRWMFGDDVALENIHIQHPAGQAYVLPDERYASISIVATDGKALSKSSHITITAVSTSFNEKFKINEDLIRPMSSENPLAGLSWGTKYAQLWSHGKEVLISRVGVTVKGKFLRGRTYQVYDWDLRLIGSGTVQGDVLEIAADQPVTFMELYHNP